MPTAIELCRNFGLLGFAVVTLATPALAQQMPEDDVTPETTEDDDRAEGPSTADPDVKPEAPVPVVPNPAQDVRTYAGVGSGVAYAERGVGEFGGSMSLSASKGVFNVSADPMVGYFLFDNIELSGSLGVRHLAVEGQTSDQFALLVEPSVHLPINDGLFWYGGLGVGFALADTSGSDFDSGLAIAPRTGVQLLLGRSGLLNLGGRYSAVFSDVDTNVGPLAGEAVLAFVNTFELQAGYTVMF